MKKQVLQVVFVFVLLVCFVAAASASMIGSKHNFSLSGYGNFVSDNNDQICIYCHTPHASIVQDRQFAALGTARLPLWNRSLNEGVADFTMYTSSTRNATMPADGKPTGYSLLCLSCHDGITSIGSVINNTGAAINVTPNSLAGVYPPWANPVIGRDLSDDHPVSFNYTDAIEADRLANGGVYGIQQAGLIDAALKLPGGRMECTTCHDPHNDGTGGTAPFLRISNAGSNMCLNCHIKML